MGKWKTVRLGDKIEQIRGVSYKPDDAVAIEDATHKPVLRAHNIQVSGLNMDNLIYVDASKIKEIQYIQEGDIIVCASSGSKDLVGKAAQATTSMDASFGAFCKVVRPKQNIDSRYLKHYFSSPRYRHVISELSAGVNINNLRNEHIDNLQIPLPPLDVQKKIADVLDKASALIELRRAQLDKLDLLIKSQFIEIFGDPVTNPKDFNVTSLGNVADIVSGITKGRKTKEMDLREVPYMAVSNVKDGYIDWTTVKTIAATKAEIEQYRLFPDDILMTEGGDPDKVGRGAIIRKPLQDCIHQNHIFRVRLDEEIVLPFYLAEYLMHQKAKQYFLGCAKQTTGIASINMKQLRAMPVLVPPIELQSQFSIFVEQVEEKKNLLNQSLSKLELNYKSLMQKCFRGEVFLL